MIWWLTAPCKRLWQIRIQRHQPHSRAHIVAFRVVKCDFHVDVQYVRYVAVVSPCCFGFPFVILCLRVSTRNMICESHHDQLTPHHTIFRNDILFDRWIYRGVFQLRWLLYQEWRMLVAAILLSKSMYCQGYRIVSYVPFVLVLVFTTLNCYRWVLNS